MKVIGQAGDIGQSKWDLDTPVLLVDLPVMEGNIERMARTFREAGVNWRPHTKGQKIPAIAHKEMAAGAKGITCAKLAEAEVMAGAGIQDILIANQIVGEKKIARLVNLLPHADVAVLVDSEENVEALDRAAQEKGVRLRVLVEVNVGMERAGVAPGEATVALAKSVHSREGLIFAGLQTWEAHTIRIEDPDEKRMAVEASVGLITDSARQCREAGLPVEIVSCGGTGDYWISAVQPGVTEIEAGGGIFSDVHYRTHLGLQHEYALFILATVTSRPNPYRIVCDAGKKTMSSDAAVPEPVGVGKVKSVSLSAEHGKIELEEPNTTLKVGDKIEFVVGYGDTTVHLHEEMYGIRDGKVEVVWPILGRGKLR
jgi:D-serine deaminase-like pyridoxal phosphate-dependent protein